MADFINQFEGTASFYARYRLGYPDSVFDLLSSEVPLTASSRVLDLGCGSGLIAVPLAGRVGSVTGVDPDPDMLVEAARAATADGVMNARWVLSTAEAFHDESASYDLVVVASAFHWMDRAAVASKAYEFLRPGGLLAIAGNPTPIDQIRRRQGVGAAIADVQERWFAEIERPLVNGPVSRPEEVLRASPFADAVVHRIECEQRWNTERLIGFLRSTSWRPDQRLGDRFSAFAADVADAIHLVEPSGEWTFLSQVEIILSRR